MEAKRCSSNSNIAAIHIFIKGLWDAHNTTVKIYEKDPQTLLEVIKLVKNFNAAQQVMATLTSTVNMMSNEDQCLVCGKTGHIGHHCLTCCVTIVKSLATLPKNGLTKSLHQEHRHHNRSHSLPRYDHNPKDRS